MSNTPVTRKLGRDDVGRVRELFTGRGHDLRKNPKNQYIAFEVRTDGRSIFTLYTSGKLVSTVREGDAEGFLIEQTLIDQGLGDVGPRAPPKRALEGRAAHADVAWLAGADETGTGELIGRAILGAALHTAALAPSVSAIAGAVETKSSRAASGWDSLAQALRGLRSDGLVLATIGVPNALFDVYSKNALLDLAYLRLVTDLFAASEFGAASAAGAEGVLRGVELVIDDYGVGPLLHAAAECWRARGLRVLFETKADDNHLAARAASVYARAQRSREMAGLRADTDEPLGTGNAGDRTTLTWLRRNTPADGCWPAFVKGSFRTARDMLGLPAVTKRRLPALDDLLDADSAQALRDGRVDAEALRVIGPGGRRRRSLATNVLGEPLDGECAAWSFLPLLCGGLVLADDVWRLDAVEAMTARDVGLLSGWRVLVGPQHDGDDPVLVALSRAHRAGVIDVVPTDVVEPMARARHFGAALVSGRTRSPVFSLRLRD